MRSSGCGGFEWRSEWERGRVGCWLGALALGSGGEPVGWVGVGEGVVVGVGGGVLVGGVGALVGVEEGEAGFDGVFFVAGLVEEV